MSGASFFDSNIFIYLHDTGDSRKQARAQQLVSAAVVGDDVCISFQVVQEVLHVLTGKFAKRVPSATAREALRHVLLPLWRVHPSAALYRRALDLQARYGLSFYDSLIVAAALEAQCSRLLTEDLQHGQQIEGLSIENPFLEAVASAE